MNADRLLFAVAPALLGAFIATVLYPVFRHEEAGIAAFGQIVALVVIGAVAAKVSPRDRRMDGAAAGWMGFYVGIGFGALLRILLGHTH